MRKETENKQQMCSDKAIMKGIRMQQNSKAEAKSKIRKQKQQIKKARQRKGKKKENTTN
jgi:hypothetical protein